MFFGRLMVGLAVCPVGVGLGALAAGRLRCPPDAGLEVADGVGEGLDIVV